MKYEDGFLILTDAEVELLACTARAKVEPLIRGELLFHNIGRDEGWCDSVFERRVSQLKGDLWRRYPNSLKI